MTATRGGQIPNTQLVTAESLKYICTMILIQPDGNAAAFLTCCMAAASSMTFTKNVEGEERVLRAQNTSKFFSSMDQSYPKVL